MSKDKQIISVEWLADKLASLNFDYLTGQIKNKEFNERHKQILKLAKAMHFNEQEQVLFKYFEWHKRKGYEKHELDHFTEFYKENYES